MITCSLHGDLGKVSPYLSLDLGYIFHSFFLFFVYSASKTALRTSQSIKKARLTYIEKGEKIHSINKASIGLWGGIDALTNGSKKPVFMRVCGLFDPLQNRVPRVRVLLPLPSKNGLNTGFRPFFFLSLWSERGLNHPHWCSDLGINLLSGCNDSHLFRLLQHQKSINRGGVFFVSTLLFFVSCVSIFDRLSWIRWSLLYIIYQIVCWQPGSAVI